MAVTKRGKFYHYQFMVDGQPHRGSTKETVKARAEQVEAVLKAEAKGFKGTIVGANKAPVLRLFDDRFLRYVNDQVEAGTLDKDTGKYYTYGWKQLEVTDLAKMRMDQIGTSDAAIIQLAVSASYATKPSGRCAGCSTSPSNGECSARRRRSRLSKSMAGLP